MALLNNLYIFVEEESVDMAINSTTHPVEKGLPTTSTIKKEPIELSIQGKLVDNSKYDAETVKKKIEKLKDEGSLIKYVGSTNLSNMQIQSFNCGYSNKGIEYSMTLKQVRIAKPSYQKKTSTKTQTAVKTAKKTTPTLKVGATVIFKGGYVYVSSTAKKASAKRGRSTCKLTKIASSSNATHKYHLISKDGKKVYGWVDKSNIEGKTKKKSACVQKTGTQAESKNGQSAFFDCFDGAVVGASTAADTQHGSRGPDQ